MKRTALATLALGVGPHMFAGVGPARAQQRLGAVVCVTSELETLGGSGPVRRVIRKDVELVYRVGFTLADLEEVEQSLEKELGPGGETWCARSDPEHSHVVVVSYQGVVREDLTIDPGDPRFQSFAVGYGASWEEAERNATMLNDRFATNNDGSGYEVLVRERWGVEDAARAGGDVRATAEEVEEVRPVERPPPLEPEREQPVTGPSTVFRDCSACPKMVVLPAGVFTMGSPNTEEGRFDREGPRHSVRIESPLAVGVYEVTFAEWDACVRARGCEGYRAADEGWGRGRRPVINVSWEDAQGLRVMGLAGDGGVLPAVERGGVGACGARGDDHGPVLGGGRGGTMLARERVRSERCPDAAGTAQYGARRIDATGVVLRWLC